MPVHGEIRGWAVLPHCFPNGDSDGDSDGDPGGGPASVLARAMNRERVAVLAYDLRGTPRAEGASADNAPPAGADDVVHAARYLEEAEGSAPDLLVGHSLGGVAALHAARKLASVRGVATLGAPSGREAVLALALESTGEIEAAGRGTITLGDRTFPLQLDHLSEADTAPLQDVVEALRSELLVLHGDQDRVLPIEHGARLFRMARHPRSFVTLAGADHFLSAPADARYAGRLLSAWVGRLLADPDAEDREPPVTGERVVVRTGGGGTVTEIWADGHGLIADEPPSAGGTGEGPTPYDLVASGLGACTAMTAVMYARRKEWPLEGVRVVLRHRKRHADDEDLLEDGADARIDVIEREVELRGPLDEEQRRRVVALAERCPVHRTLEAGVDIRTRLVEGS